MANFDLGKIIATWMGFAGKAYDQIIATGKELSKEDQLIDVIKVEESVSYRIINNDKVIVAFTSLNPNIFQAFSLENIIESLNESSSGRLGIGRKAGKDGKPDRYFMYGHLAAEPMDFQMAASAKMDDDLCDIFKFKTKDDPDILNVVGEFATKLLSFAQESGLPPLPTVDKQKPCEMFAGNNPDEWFLLSVDPTKTDFVDAPSSWKVTIKSFFTDEEPFVGDIEIQGPEGINWSAAVIDLEETKGTFIVGTPRIRLNTGTQKKSTVGVSAKMKKWDSVVVKFTSSVPVHPGKYQFTAVAYDGENHGEGADKKVTFKKSKNFSASFEIGATNTSGTSVSQSNQSFQTGVGRKSTR